MEGDSASPIIPQVPGYYWAVPNHWLQRQDNLAVVEVVPYGDGLVVYTDSGNAALDEYTFYSGPLIPPEIPPPAAWYRPEASP